MDSDDLFFEKFNVGDEIIYLYVKCIITSTHKVRNIGIMNTHYIQIPCLTVNYVDKDGVIREMDIKKDLAMKLIDK